MFFTSSMNDTVPIQYFLSMSKWVQIFMFTYRFSFTSMPCMKILLVSTLARETKWPYMNEYQVPPLNVQPWKLPKPLVPFCTFMHNLNQVPHWSEIPVIKTMQDFSRSLWAANLFIIHDIYMPRFGTLMYFARSMNTTHFLRPGLWMILRVLLLAPGVEHFFCVGESICTNRWDLLGMTGHYMQYERCSRKEHAKVSQLHQIPPFQVVHQRWWMQETCPLDLCKFDFIWKMNYEDHFVYSILAFTLKLIFSFLSAWGPARRFYWKVSAWATRCRNLVYHYCRMQYVEFVNSVILQIWLKPSLKGDSVIGVILQIRCWSAQTLPGTKLSPLQVCSEYTTNVGGAMHSSVMVLWFQQSCDFNQINVSSE